MMFNGLKNFAINKVLRHVADNPKLNHATNILALIPVAILAALSANPDWVLLFRCCDAPGSLVEAVRVGSLVASAVLLWLCGKLTWLKQWLPVAEEIIAEVEKDLLESAAKEKAEKK